MQKATCILLSFCFLACSAFPDAWSARSSLLIMCPGTTAWSMRPGYDRASADGRFALLQQWSLQGTPGHGPANICGNIMGMRGAIETVRALHGTATSVFEQKSHHFHLMPGVKSFIADCSATVDLLPLQQVLMLPAPICITVLAGRPGSPSLMRIS